MIKTGLLHGFRMVLWLGLNWYFDWILTGIKAGFRLV